MRLIEGIGSELFPVTPNLLQDGWIMSIFLSLLNKLRLHRINDVLLLLTHRLTQGIRLTSGEVSQLSGKKHHLLLIHRNAISILQVLLHARDVILDFLLTVLTGDERRDIIHRSRTIQGIHRNQVLKHGWLQLTKILLHTRRLKLERTNGLSSLVKFVSQRIIYRNMVEIDILTERLFHYLACLLQLRESLQAQEVHLDQTS